MGEYDVDIGVCRACVVIVKEFIAKLTCCNCNLSRFARGNQSV